MKIDRDGGRVTVFPEGRIDANAAPDFAAAMGEALKGAEDLTLDLRGLEYISSSGLRAVMLAIRTMSRQGRMRIVNAAKGIYDILEMTGFTGACDVALPDEELDAVAGGLRAPHSPGDFEIDNPQRAYDPHP